MNFYLRVLYPIGNLHNEICKALEIVEHSAEQEKIRLTWVANNELSFVKGGKQFLTTVKSEEQCRSLQKLKDADDLLKTEA